MSTPGSETVGKSAGEGHRPRESQPTWESAPIPKAAAALSGSGIREPLDVLLARRGVTDAEEAGVFLSPGLGQLHAPGLLPGMERAVERLLRAREHGERVAIVGDYDVDGVSGTALLAAVLRACKIDTLTILPHRMRDGYGLQEAQVRQAQADGASLIVTVDCGTSALGPVHTANELGLEVIVTDHHLPGPELPEATIINPRLPGSTYPCPHLCGAGLALKLAMETAAACGLQLDPLRLLRVACLGTIADLVPLVDENRAIAALGLRELARCRSPGLQALINRSGMKPPFVAADVGFRLGPRLNAPGRMDSAEPSLELLLTRDPERAAELAELLDTQNQARRELEQQVAEEATEGFLGREQLPPILVAWSPGWHRGVVGIAASRVARQLGRPTILLAQEGDLATGSGRSVGEIDLHAFLQPWAGQLQRFGGHARAVGLSAETSQLESLLEEWESAAEAWGPGASQRSHSYELSVQASQADSRLLRVLRQLEPHGEGNPQPLLRIPGPLRLCGPSRVFGRGHLKAEARHPDGGRIRLLGWGWAERKLELESDFEVLGYLEADNYRGGAVLRLEACRPWTEEVAPGAGQAS